MHSEVKDVWFRSELKLRDIAQRLDLEGVIEDGEDFWDWVIGRFGDVKLDITRTHTQPPELVWTRIFVVDHEDMSSILVTELIHRLRSFIPSVIYCGRWWFRTGNDFDLEVSQEFVSPGDTFNA